MTTLVATRNQPAPARAVSSPAWRSPSTARTSPSMSTARAASSLQARAIPTATAYQPQLRRVASHQANSSGVMIRASGWKGQQLQRHRPQGHPDGLDQVEELRPGPEPVGGHEQHGDQVRVVLEEVEPADGHERVLELGKQPDALVVQAHVVAEGPEVGVLVPGQPAEDGHVRADQQPEDGRGPALGGHSAVVARRRSSAAMNWSRSPSRTAWMFPVSSPVRWSLTIW